MAALALATPAAAQSLPENFQTGPVFTDFGPHAPVAGLERFPLPTEFRHSFDVATRADAGTRNRGFESAARFINMHVAAGVDAGRIDTVVVVHGSAVLDLLTDDALAARPRAEGVEAPVNGSAAMVRTMLDHGVRFVVCGQSAAAQGVERDDLIEGVEMALSAMTAHALLQQQGYTVNPF
ncbi:DsrE family protein [Erythrobacter sp. EC-HK427]|uniref:DsrE family protein n=1 Tax=Erythrobacter sp. EC-HK427 TaxID=2038396 RepID=UPI001F2A8BE5|nr:DsrE family protein [Erythrobacter sp. EC-HK427]